MRLDLMNIEVMKGDFKVGCVRIWQSTLASWNDCRTMAFERCFGNLSLPMTTETLMSQATAAAYAEHNQVELRRLRSS